MHTVLLPNDMAKVFESFPNKLRFLHIHQFSFSNLVQVREVSVKMFSGVSAAVNWCLVLSVFKIHLILRRTTTVVGGGTTQPG